MKTPSIESPFNKIQVFCRHIYSKRDFGAAVFLWIFQNFWEKIFYLNTSSWLLLYVNLSVVPCAIISWQDLHHLIKQQSVKFLTIFLDVKTYSENEYN